jgi:hypothetical protein
MVAMDGNSNFHRTIAFLKRNLGKCSTAVWRADAAREKQENRCAAN